MNPEIRSLLELLERGELSIEEVEAKLPFTNVADFAVLDLEREKRTGLPEVVFGSGKKAHQISALFQALHDAGQVAIATRVDEEKAQTVIKELSEVIYHPTAMLLTWGKRSKRGSGIVGVVCAGTSDIPVAEEAALVLEHLGHKVERVRDVGVAGIHRLIHKLEVLRSCKVLIVVAGMEGALPSVVAGLTGRPVIAVPTSIGYGAAFGGLAALLGMLNSCATGVSVVNIDNGFGAACQAALINED